MAINTGSRFWANIQSEPKRKYRFVLQLGGIEAWTITQVQRPSFNVTETEHTFYNHKFYYPGKVEWQTVSFSLVDPIHPDATAYIMGILGACGYRVPTPDQYLSISKKRAVEVLGQPKIKAKDADGEDVEIWTLVNAWVKNVNMDSFEYASDDMLRMEVEMRYDYALFNSVGQANLSIQTPPGSPVSVGKEVLENKAP
tara:strand:+ start:2653 stop:3246 length:594 start_codon:yes stop_codon:yes gene_type:complete